MNYLNMYNKAMNIVKKYIHHIDENIFNYIVREGLIREYYYIYPNIFQYTIKDYTFIYLCRERQKDYVEFLLNNFTIDCEINNMNLISEIGISKNTDLFIHMINKINHNKLYLDFNTLFYNIIDHTNSDIIEYLMQFIPNFDIFICFKNHKIINNTDVIIFIIQKFKDNIIQQINNIISILLEYNHINVINNLIDGIGIERFAKFKKEIKMIENHIKTCINSDMKIVLQKIYKMKCYS